MSKNNARTRAIRAHAKATGLSYLTAMRDLDAAKTLDVVPKPGIDWDAIISAPHTPFGAGPSGPQLIDWATNPHLIVTGDSGTGKSWSVQNLITFGLLRGDDVYVSDMLKGGVDYEFAAPWTRATATNATETLAMLTEILAEMTRRYSLCADHGTASYSQLPADVRPPQTLVIIDGASTLTRHPQPKALDGSEDAETVTRHATDVVYSDVIARISMIAGRIMRSGRSAGITLILAAQRLSETDLVPGATGLASNLTRVKFSTRYPDGDQTNPDPRQPRGRSIIELRDGDGTSMPVTVDVPSIDTDELRAALEARMPRLSPGDRLNLS